MPVPGKISRRGRHFLKVSDQGNCKTELVNVKTKKTDRTLKDILQKELKEEIDDDNNDHLRHNVTILQ